MFEKSRKRGFLRRFVYRGMFLCLLVVLIFVGFQILNQKSVDDLYGPYPEASLLKDLRITNPNAPKPNIIIIYCDDLGYGDVGCYGSKAISTPNVDSLAEQGQRFTDYYACNAVCAPSRAGLLTGRYPFRTGVIGNPYPDGEPLSRRAARKLGSILKGMGMLDLREDYAAKGLDSREITIAEGLKLAGYRTAMVGKWHLGDYSKDPAYNPIRHGFDQYMGVPHSNDMKPCPRYRNDTELEADIGTDQAKITGLYTKEAVEFIQDSTQAPFFLYLAHTFPHQPLYASEQFDGKSKAGKFGDAVEEIDWSVGEILSALEKQGIEDNTLLVFTSDNGPWFEGSPGVFRGRKGQSYEGGFRVPFIVKWPGQVPAGQVSESPIMNLDLFPTLLSLAGVGLPQDRVIDGKDIFPLLSGQDTSPPHEAIYFYHYDILEGVRADTWKYIRSINRYVWPVPCDTAVVPDRLGKKQLGNRWPLLFDLSLDPQESYNVIDTYPHSANRLLRIMEAWEQDVEDNPRGFKGL